jgi:hypothetical protein
MKRSLLLQAAILGIASFLPVNLVVNATSTTNPNPVKAPTVNLGYATYQGTFDSALNLTQFLGIRYASPPVGKYCSLRLRLSFRVGRSVSAHTLKPRLV